MLIRNNKRLLLFFSFLFLFAIVMILILYFSYSKTNLVHANEGRKSIHSAHADYPVLNTVTELTYRADLIVTGSFTGNRTPKFYTDDNNEIIVKASISEFEVGSLYKGNIDDRIISVVEPGYEDDSSIYTIEGYKLMNDTDEYVLFLNDTYDGSYRIVGMYQGQYKLENALGRNALNYFDEETEYFESEDQIEHFTRLKEQVVEKIALFEKEE